MKNFEKINTKSFKLSDQIFFAQRLSLLLSSGISIVEALNMMRNMDNSQNRKEIYRIIIQDMEKGVSLGRSIINMKIRFNSLLITLIQNGENSGHLAEALMYAYDHLEKKNEMKKKITSSLVYPAFIVLATIIMTLFLILYIFPKIIPLLNSLDIKLPLITRIVQGSYYFLISYGLWSILFIFLTILIFNIIIRRNLAIRYRFHLFIISIPFLNNYIKTYLLSSVCSIGEMLLSSGKGLPDLIIFSRDSSRNLVYKKLWNDMYIESMHGIAISISLKKRNRFFPRLLSDMCILGEKTGGLGPMLGHCGRIFEQDIDNSLKRFSSLVEPILMVFMGLIVGSIALSIILPVYEITNHLSK